MKTKLIILIGIVMLITTGCVKTDRMICTNKFDIKDEGSCLETAQTEYRNDRLYKIVITRVFTFNNEKLVEDNMEYFNMSSTAYKIYGFETSIDIDKNVVTLIAAGRLKIIESTINKSESTLEYNSDMTKDMFRLTITDKGYTCE